MELLCRHIHETSLDPIFVFIFLAIKILLFLYIVLVATLLELLGISNFELSKKLDNEVFIPHTDLVNKFLQHVPMQIYTVVMLLLQRALQRVLLTGTVRGILSGQYYPTNAFYLLYQLMVLYGKFLIYKTQIATGNSEK